MIALKNLQAEAIEKIELYDEKSEQAKLTGFNDGQSVRTLISSHTRHAEEAGSDGYTEDMAIRTNIQPVLTFIRW
ncbi:MAG: hypothetical protein PHD61_08160 [Bacteroidales bacterium]|nr:hypothetical protein [Lentimicrobiaceae bacterium]MDD5695264.1 hypothetical protein [Bacteroidales bacterium]